MDSFASAMTAQVLKHFEGYVDLDSFARQNRAAAAGQACFHKQIGGGAAALSAADQQAAWGTVTSRCTCLWETAKNCAVWCVVKR